MAHVFLDRIPAYVRPEMEALVIAWAETDKQGARLLAPADQFDARAYAAAVVRATGVATDAVHFVSRANPSPRPSWMSAGAFHEALASDLGDTLAARLKVGADENAIEDLHVGLWHGFGERLDAGTFLTAIRFLDALTSGDVDRAAAFQELLFLQQSSEAIGWIRSPAGEPSAFLVRTR